ncbi:MAG TPA: metallophosphoesterase family protein [Pirellulaceae bacterium]|nr:metallophosphoesterase family protein [Pirellulaceae bacterium]
MNEERIAIISDIHANWEALSSVLAHIADQRVDRIFCLGDIVGYGPNPRECIDACREFHMCLLGNHDNGALFDPDGFNVGAERAIFWTRAQLEDPLLLGARERWNFLAQLPRTHRINGAMFVHGSPRNPLNEYVFPEDVFNQRKMDRIFALVPNYCFQGHTHVPGVFTESGRFFSPDQIGHAYELADQKLMINVGSVGQPRDLNPRSCYVVWHGRRIEFHRVEYDCHTTQAKIRAIPELDPFSGDRLLEGK